MGSIVGLLTLASGIYMNSKGVIPLYQAFLIALSVFLYLSIIPHLMNISSKLVRPVFLSFDKLCAKHHINYKFVPGFRSMRIEFAEGTKWNDRFKFGLFGNLILFLQGLTFIFVFFATLSVMFLLVYSLPWKHVGYRGIIEGLGSEGLGSSLYIYHSVV